MDNLYFDDDTDIQAILTGKLTLVLLSAVMATLKLYALHWLNSLPRGLPRKRVKKKIPRSRFSYYDQTLQCY